MRPSDAPTQLGLRANWRQFTLLVLVNAFVGGMAGMERVALPLLAEREFAIASRTAILSFLVAFGLVKAAANLFAGRASERFGRKRILVAGWLAGLPVPVLILLAPSWDWIVFANVLLGINQGLCWSTTVIMKIDLAGPERRGLALGLNESGGYLAVSAAALISGYLAGAWGLRFAPFAIGATLAVAGLVASLVLVRETLPHARHEGRARPAAAIGFGEVFRRTSWKDRTLFGATQAGLVNNLNDGMAWGLLPLYFAGYGLPLPKIGFLAALYPAVWGASQLFTGAMSDRVGRRPLISWGMYVQAAAIGLLVLTHDFAGWTAASVLLGLGTAMVYPTLLAAVADVAHPDWRASALGVYRLWRDSGYALGALLAGAVSDLAGVGWAIGAVGTLTFFSGGLAALTMKNAAPARNPAAVPLRT